MLLIFEKREEHQHARVAYLFVRFLSNVISIHNFNFMCPCPIIHIGINRFMRILITHTVYFCEWFGISA
jgi:hypothetical protein